MQVKTVKNLETLGCLVGKTKVVLSLLDGKITIPKGTGYRLGFLRNTPHKALVHFEGYKKPFAIYIGKLHGVVEGIRKKPSERTLEQWAYGGAKTVTGQEAVPLCGWGSDGSPSWLLVFSG